jgi:hypothetical protein
MDNASNCDVTAAELTHLVPGFRGAISRTRCFAHIINLVAKAFISFFFLQSKRKKGVTRPKRGSAKEPNQGAVDEDANEIDVNLQEAIDAEIDDEPGQDEAKAIHDEEGVRGVKAEAVEFAKACGLVLSARDEKEALTLFPKVGVCLYIKL